MEPSPQPQIPHSFCVVIISKAREGGDWKEVLCRLGFLAVWPFAEQSNFGSSAAIFFFYRNHWKFEGKGIS